MVLHPTGRWWGRTVKHLALCCSQLVVWPGFPMCVCEHCTSRLQSLRQLFGLIFNTKMGIIEGVGCLGLTKFYSKWVCMVWVRSLHEHWISILYETWPILRIPPLQFLKKHSKTHTTPTASLQVCQPKYWVDKHYSSCMEVQSLELAGSECWKQVSL